MSAAAAFYPPPEPLAEASTKLSGAEATGQVVLIVVIFVARAFAATGVPALAARARGESWEVNPAKTRCMEGIV